MLRKDKLHKNTGVLAVNKKTASTLSSLENACLLGFYGKPACSELEEKTNISDNCDGKCENIPEDISSTRPELA